MKVVFILKKLVIMLLTLVAMSLSASTANADQYVNGYYNHNGNYVQGYHRSDRDGNPDNNYSHYGNVNPYTGKRGTVR